MSTIEGVVVAPVAAVTPAPAATSDTAVVPGNVTPAAPAVQPGVTLSPPVVAPASGTVDQWSSLSPENKAAVEAKGWKSHDDIVKSALEAERKLSTTRPVDAPTELAAYDAVTAPPENAKDIGYNDDFAKWFKDTSLSGKVPLDIAKHYHTEFVKWAGEQAVNAGTGQATALNERVSGTQTALHKAWGEANNPSFTRNLEMSQRAINNLDPGLRAALIETGVIAAVGGKEVAANAVIIQALAKAGEAMFSEDTLFGNPTETKANPFDPATLNLTEQSAIWNRNKDTAKSLIRALPPAAQARYANMLAG